MLTTSASPSRLPRLGVSAVRSRRRCHPRYHPPRRFPLPRVAAKAEALQAEGEAVAVAVRRGSQGARTRAKRVMLALVWVTWSGQARGATLVATRHQVECATCVSACPAPGPSVFGDDSGYEFHHQVV